MERANKNIKLAEEAKIFIKNNSMLKKIISHIGQKKAPRKELDFFDLPVSKQRKIVEEAARLSAQDQKNLLLEYERKFGELQTNSCK